MRASCSRREPRRGCRLSDVFLTGAPLVVAPNRLDNRGSSEHYQERLRSARGAGRVKVPFRQFVGSRKVSSRMALFVAGDQAAKENASSLPADVDRDCRRSRPRDGPAVPRRSRSAGVVDQSPACGESAPSRSCGSTAIPAAGHSRTRRAASTFPPTMMIGK